MCTSVGQIQNGCVIKATVCRWENLAFMEKMLVYLPMPQLKILPSPNFSSRNGTPVSMLVLHYTDTLSAKDALDILCDRQAQVSSHCVVDEDGTIYSLVDEAGCAWHAGVIFWRGNRNVNNISVGIE